MTALSLTSLEIIQDYTLSPRELRVHPDLVEAIKKAFFEADALRSHLSPVVKHQFPHPFTSVGDEEDGA